MVRCAKKTIFAIEMAILNVFWHEKGLGPLTLKRQRRQKVSSCFFKGKNFILGSVN